MRLKERGNQLSSIPITYFLSSSFVRHSKSRRSARHCPTNTYPYSVLYFMREACRLGVYFWLGLKLASII